MKKRKSPRKFFAAQAFIFASALFFAQEEVLLNYTYEGRYSYTERANFSTYIDGKYSGLTHREVRADISCTGKDSTGSMFSGFFYVAEEMRKDMKNVSLPLDEVIPASFTVTGKGKMIFSDDGGYPRMRNFPAFPEGSVKPGDYWEAEAVRIIDPKNTGLTAEMPVYVAYTFAGTEEYRGRLVHRIKAKYAARMGKYSRVRSMDPELEEVSGTHDADILVDSETGLLMMILDRLDETFTYRGGKSIRFRGSSAVFTEQAVQSEKGVLPREITRIAEAAGESAKAAGTIMPKSADDTFPDEAFSPDSVSEGNAARLFGEGESLSSGRFSSDGSVNSIDSTGSGEQPYAGLGAFSSAAEKAEETARSMTEIAENYARTRAEEYSPRSRDGENTEKEASLGENAEAGSPFTVDVTEQGIKLSVRDIRFKPDSDEILPEEAWRLDAIAETLKLVNSSGQNFLIEGHTASVGKPNGEKELSVRRAQKIAGELSARGIPAERFLYTGYGGTRPVADNSTSEGRAQNRRVEITIIGAQ